MEMHLYREKYKLHKTPDGAEHMELSDDNQQEITGMNIVTDKSLNMQVNI
jgi:hypothetical protein